MTCWKCGKTCHDNQVECEKCMNVTVTYNPDVRHRAIDWNKVHSFEQAKKIFQRVGYRVLVGSEDEEYLREFLADP